MSSRRGDGSAGTPERTGRVTRAELRRQTQELERRILAVATEQFSRNGFLGTTTQEVADAVGLIKGTLYYHIGSKEELLWRIHDQVVEEGLTRWSPLVERADEDSRVVLRAMVVEHCRIIAQYRDSVAVFIEEAKFLSPELSADAFAKRQAYQQMLDQVLRRGVERRELAIADVRLTSLILMSMMNSTYRWYRPGGRLGPEQLADAILSLALNGLEHAPTMSPVRPAPPAGRSRKRR